MDDDIEEHDWYALLEVPMSASEEDIGKAFRTLARTAHPDRNKDDPNAVSRFHLIKRASEILLDVATRASYDSLVQTRLLRKKRDHEASENVQRLKATLFARESEAVAVSAPKGDALKKVREENAIYRAERADRAAKKAQHEKKNAELKASLPASFHITTAVLRWSNKLRQYSENDISAIVKQFGSVEATIMAGSGNSATIILSSLSSAQNLVESLSPTSTLGTQYGFTAAFVKHSTAPSLSSFSPSPPLSSPSSSHAPFSPILNDNPLASASSPATEARSVVTAADDDEFEAMVLSMMKGTKKNKIS